MGASGRLGNRRAPPLSVPDVLHSHCGLRVLEDLSYRHALHPHGITFQAGTVYHGFQCKSHLQIVQFMEENDTHLPALAVCDGVTYYPDTKRLAAFTGDRFFRCLAASCSSGSPGSPKGAAMHIPPSETHATESFFRIVEGEAPATLSIGQMIELLSIAKFYMADSVVALLPSYFATAMQQMTAAEVCNTSPGRTK